MDMRPLAAVWICMTVVVVVGGADGLIWTEESALEGAVIKTCLGEEVSLPWQFITEADETVVSVEWYKNSEGIETILAIHKGGQFFRSPVTHLKLSLLSNAGLHVANLTWADYGTYTVKVNVVHNGGQLWSSSREAVISPPDAPVLAGGRLVAQRIRLPVTDNVTGELHVQLKCGTFLALGSRPLSVLWKTPSGHTVPSTDRSADSFFLTLPNPIEGGTYFCHLENDTALQACVKNAQSMSSLKRGAFVQLDETETQLSILGAQAMSLFSRDQDVRSSLKKEVTLLRQDLQQCNDAGDALSWKVSELREELSERKKTEQDLQRQVDVLSTSTHDLRSTLALKETAYTQLADQMSRVTSQLQDVRSSYDELRSELGKTQSKIGGSVYVRWGGRVCPDSAETLYSGVVGGSYYNNAGAAANALCLPLNPVYDGHPLPQWGPTNLYGAEYEVYPEPKNKQDPLCSVCVSPRPHTVMIPATNTCHPGWTVEYTGYIMAGLHNHLAATEFICMDASLDARVGSYVNHNGNIFYYTVGKCGSLPCPPYEENKIITCVVCSK